MKSLGIRRMKKILSIVFVLSALTTSFAAEIRVSAAASLTEALKEIAAAYEKQTGDKVFFNFAASSFLALQIEQGAPADIFFSADEAKMDGLDKKGLVEKSTRKSLLSNALVIVVSVDQGASISNPKDLLDAKVKRVALAETKTVPAGIYAKEFLQNQNLWTGLEPKIVPTENVRGALSAVEAGNADAAIVYKTDAAISKKVKVAYEVPATDSPAISYPVAVLKEAKNPDGAKAFLKRLYSDEATAVFRKFGFIVK
jgi:molybdate transport system substrate-binding protein